MGLSGRRPHCLEVPLPHPPSAPRRRQEPEFLATQRWDRRRLPSQLLTSISVQHLQARLRPEPVFLEALNLVACLAVRQRRNHSASSLPQQAVSLPPVLYSVRLPPPTPLAADFSVPPLQPIPSPVLFLALRDRR